jgi:membrane protein implicated in regulation of membrane protease activity
MTDSSLQRLERTDTVLYLGLTIALFAGLLLFPYWGQVVWVALIGAAYIRLTIVIMRRERQLTLMTEREGGQRTTCDHRGQGHIRVGDSLEEGLTLGDHLDRSADARRIPRRE